MQVDSLLLSKFKVLRSAERFLQSGAKVALYPIEDKVVSLRLYISSSAKIYPTGFAFGDGVVGRIVGKFDNGTPAFEALKFKL